MAKQWQVLFKVLFLLFKRRNKAHFEHCIVIEIIPCIIVTFYFYTNAPIESALKDVLSTDVKRLVFEKASPDQGWSYPNQMHN